MARPLLIEFPGAVYRVTSRGDQREAIHEDRASPCLADRDRAGNRALRCRHSRLLPDGQPLSFGHPCWSSYNAHTGNATSPVWLDTPAVHGYLLGRDAATVAGWRRAGSRYAALMAAGRGFNLWDEALSQQIYLGDAEFIERMLALIRKTRVLQKISRAPNDLRRLSRSTIILNKTKSGTPYSRRSTR